jgi:lipid A 3-O-deacylase
MPAHRRVAARDLGVIVAFAAAVAATTAQAQWYRPEGVFGTAGYNSGAQVALAGIGASWDITRRSKARDETGFAGRIDGQIAHWRGLGTPTDNHYLWDFSAIPMLRYTFDWTASPRIYVEGGFGIHFLTHTRINNDRRMGASFQFGEIGGVGVTFGPGNKYELGVFVQHVSNGNTARYNWGLTYPALVFRTMLP